MNRIRTLIAASIALFFIALFPSHASPVQENAEGWRAAVESPITSLFMFQGSFNGNGELSVSIAGVTNSIIHQGEWGCGAGGWEDTPWMEVSLTLDTIYECSITAEDAYGLSVGIKRVPLHTILDRGGALDKQFNLYKLYILNRETGEWEKLCPENSPSWTIEEQSEGCHTHTLNFSIQLRRDYGARPINRPGLKSLEGDEEPEVWTSETGGVSVGSAPGDEKPLRVSAPRNGDPWSMTRNWDASLGRLWSGGSAGRIRLQGVYLTALDFQRKSIVYVSPTYDTNEVQVMTSLADTNEIEQLRVPQCLVVMTNTAVMAFEMRYYPLTVINGIDSNGFYTFPTNSVPFVTWRIDSPGNSTNSYRLSELRPWITNITTLTYNNNSNLWALTRGSGADTRIETRAITISTSTNGANITTNRLELHEIKDGSGIVATRNSELLVSKPWGQFELTVLTNDPGGDNLVTTFEYGEDPDLDGSYRQMISTTWPDGYWEIRDYFHTDTNAWFDIVGRLRIKVNPWKDTPKTWDTNDWPLCHYTEYQWDDTISPGAYTLTQRHYDTIEDFETMPGAGRTYIEQLKYVEICQDTSQLLERLQLGNDYHHGELIDTLNFTLNAGPLAGQLSSRVDWMRVKDSYDYLYGYYDPTNRTFAVDTNGIDTKQVIYHGSHWETGAPDEPSDFIASGESTHDIDGIYMLPFYSTKDVNILDDGQLVLTLRYVYTGGETNYALLDEVRFQRDALGHTTNAIRIDPSTGEERVLRQANWTGTNSFPGPLKFWEVDGHGVKTTFSYDALNRVKTATKTGVQLTGFPDQFDVTATFGYDASDRIVNETTSGNGGMGLTAFTVYDKVGRPVTTIDEGGYTNRISYQLGGRQTSLTNSAGATKVTLNFLDRRIQSVSGSAQIAEFYDYNLTAEAYADLLFPKNVTKKTLGSTNATRWTATATDQRKKAAREDRPEYQSTNILRKDFAVSAATIKGFDLYSTRVPIYEEGWEGRIHREIYNSFGEKRIEGNEVGYYEPADIASTNRVTTFLNRFQTNAAGHWLHVQNAYIHPIDNSSASNLLSRTAIRLTGFPSNQISEELTFDANTNETATATFIDLLNRKLTVKNTIAQSSLSATQTVVNGLLQTESTHTVSSLAWHYYDVLGREIAFRDPLGFVSGSLLDWASGQLLARTNKNGQVTAYQYYLPGTANAGLLYCETGPTGKRTFYDYNSRSQQTHVWGDVPYPEKRDYNEFGDLISLSTYRGGTLWSGTNWPANPGVTADVTTWGYDEPTGLLTSKTDPANNSVSYDYDYFGQLIRKNTARGDYSTNLYLLNGDLVQTDSYGLVTNSVITTNYNRLGLPRLVIDNSGSHLLSYDYAGRLIQDHCATGLMAGTTLKLRYHPVYGKDQVVVETTSGSVTNSVTNTFGFDGFGRIDGVTNGAQHVAYTYLPGSDLISSTESRSGGSTVLTATRTWDYGYRLRSIDNVIAGAGSVSRHEYFHDALDRRRRANLADGSAWEYNYNDRDELTRAARFWSDFTPVAGQQFEFAYDPIGNRTVAREGGDEYGQSLRTEGYGANNLNQITVRTNSSANEVIGAAYATATVTVNGDTNVHRKGEYFATHLTGGGGTAEWQSVTNVATLGVDTATDMGGRVLPPLIQNLSYDADGNLTNDSVWNYAWDPENRLIEMVMTNVTGISNDKRYKLNFTYDKDSRRVAKVVSTWNGSAFSDSQTNRFVYDGWNLISELDATNGWLRSYTWGVDLIGTLEDAGGIGALVMVQDHTNSPPLSFTAYDGNGNIIALIRSDGATTAQYEYGPYGEPLRVTGISAKDNPFRWSTKFLDQETTLVYYGYRFYAAGQGRWLSRDPITENGGLNLFAFIRNAPLAGVDPRGESTLAETEGGTAIGSFLQSNGSVQAVGIYNRVKNFVEISNELIQTGEALMDGLDKVDWDQASFSVNTDPDDIFIAAATATVQAIGTALKISKHHTMTVRHQKWTPKFELLLGTAGLSLNNTLIKVLNLNPVFGHTGPHEKYNEFVYNYLLAKMNKRDSRAGKRAAVVTTLIELAIRNNVPGDPFTNY